MSIAFLIYEDLQRNEARIELSRPGAQRDLLKTYSASLMNLYAEALRAERQVAA